MAKHFGTAAGEVQIEVKKKKRKIINSKRDISRDRDFRGRFVWWWRSLIPTNPLTSPRLRNSTPPTQTRIPFTDWKRLPEVSRLEIQSRTWPTSSTEAVIEENPTSPTTRVVFLSSTDEQILGEELEIPSEEEEQETYIGHPLIEEPEELEEPYISSEESVMAEEVEGEVHNVNGEENRIGGGRGRGGGGDRNKRRGRGRGNQDPFGFPIFDEDTTLTMKNISLSILPKFHRKINEYPETFLFEFEVLCRS